MSIIKEFARRLSKKNIVEKAELTELWQYGLSNENGIVATDKSQKLLAIGTNKGINLIRFPRNKSEEVRETFLYLSKEKLNINFLRFKTGGEYLISIFDNEELVIWNVNERKVHFQVKLTINVSSIDFYPDSNWLFLGSDNGCVYIYDIVNGILSNTCIISRTKNGENIPSAVQCISINPCKNRILIGFEHGLIIQYHIKKQKVIERYQQEEILTFIKWNPDGVHFVTGSNQGSLFFWKTGKTAKPLCKKTLKEYINKNGNENEKNKENEGDKNNDSSNEIENDNNVTTSNFDLNLINPIKKIEWLSASNNTTNLLCSEEEVIQSAKSKVTVLTFQNTEFGSPISVNQIEIDERIIDFNIIPFTSTKKGINTIFVFSIEFDLDAMLIGIVHETLNHFKIIMITGP